LPGLQDADFHGWPLWRMAQNSRAGKGVPEGLPKRRSGKTMQRQSGGYAMIEISPSKVVEVIFLAREGHLGARELAAFIDGMNVDEKAHLTALAWVGRGAFEPAEYAAAVAQAFSEATVPTMDYLSGMPHLAENLEAGLDAMGVDVAGEEEDFL
jgi:hypothetical protein